MGPFCLNHGTRQTLIKVAKALLLVMGRADRRFIRVSVFYVAVHALLSLGVEPACSIKNFAMIGSRLREGIGVEHRKDTPGVSGW